jgi:hypothetical protein
VLSIKQEAIIVAFRRPSLLPDRELPLLFLRHFCGISLCCPRQFNLSLPGSWDTCEIWSSKTLGRRKKRDGIEKID